jgi:hypothetical protein
LLAGLDQGFFKTAHLFGEFAIGQPAPANDVAGTVEHKDFTPANAGGNGDAAKQLLSFGLNGHTCRNRNNPICTP